MKWLHCSDSFHRTRSTHYGMWLHCKYAGKWFHESEIFNHSSEWQAEGKMPKQVPLRTFKINMKSIFSVICILSLRSNEARYLVEPDKRYSRKLIKTVYMFLYIVRHQTSKRKQLLLFGCGKQCISFFPVFFFHIPSCPLIGFFSYSICLNIGILWSVFLLVFINLILS